MARVQEDGITILLGLKGCQVGKVTEDGGKVTMEVRSEQEKPACSQPT